MWPPSLVSASHSAQSNKQRWSSVPAPTAIYLISECHCNKWATRARNIFPARFQRVVSAALTSIFTNGADFISTSGVDGFVSGSKHQLQITLTLWGRSQDAALFLGSFTGSVGARDTYVNKRCDFKKIPDQSVRHRMLSKGGRWRRVLNNILNMARTCTQHEKVWKFKGI